MKWFTFHIEMTWWSQPGFINSKCYWTSCYLLAVFLLTSFRDVMPPHHECRDLILWCHVTAWCYTIGLSLVSIYSNQKTREKGFWPGDLDIWPITLTSELIQDIPKANPCTRFHDHNSNSSVMRGLTDRHTATWTIGTIFVTSTTDAGGKN